jgi:hypothetical protein
VLEWRERERGREEDGPAPIIDGVFEAAWRRGMWIICLRCRG